eukprot:3577902-Alexandrium_andersonii.AAC.1
MGGSSRRAVARAPSPGPGVGGPATRGRAPGAPRCTRNSPECLFIRAQSVPEHAQSLRALAD